MENISVRKNFTPVPLYVPRVKVGADGTARIHVKLPDTLTVFMLRAEAVSGPDRFGFGTGQMPVRQPVVAQPALPRFVRPGDSFTAGLIGRSSRAPGGAGQAAISVDNLAVAGAKQVRHLGRAAARRTRLHRRRCPSRPPASRPRASASCCNGRPTGPATPCRSTCRSAPTGPSCTAATCWPPGRRRRSTSPPGRPGAPGQLPPRRHPGHRPGRGAAGRRGRVPARPAVDGAAQRIALARASSRCCRSPRCWTRPACAAASRRRGRRRSRR